LKPGNILLGTKLEVKIADFGLAAKLKFIGERRSTICGTPNFMAPEQLDKKKGHSYEADVWALGIIIYSMLVGLPPFLASDYKQVYNKV
jgi:serine/threonine protein kinase